MLSAACRLCFLPEDVQSVIPDINTEDFCAAVDYLSNREDVDAERIGILGICGWGGFAVNAVLLVHGEKAHSRYFSEDTFKKLQGGNKELYIVPDAVHTDLYDNLDKIPFDKIEEFYNQYLK